MNTFLSIISGALLSLAFPKFNFGVTAWIALVPFFIAIEKTKNAKASAFCGMVFGLSFFAFNLFWINSLSQFVGPFAVLAWLSLLLFQSVFLAVSAYISKKLNLSLTFWQAIIFTLIEWLRGTGPFGVAAGGLGYSQTGFLQIIQTSSIALVYFVSFSIFLFNIGIAKVIARKDYRLFAAAAIIIFVSLFFGQKQLENKHTTGNRQVKIAVIQGNIEQDKKMSSAYNFENFKIHEELTLIAAKENPQFIIWPETVLFTYLLNDGYFFEKIQELAKKTKAYMIIGTPYYNDFGKAFNSIVAISPSGEVVGRYDKQHLVPFGEYLPFRFILYPMLKNTGFFVKDFSKGEKNLPIEINGIKFGTLICFESTFPLKAKQRVRDGADILLILTNDAWFGNSSSPYEHFDNAIFRAIENNIYTIQAANSGISGVIDPQGRIIKKLPLNSRGFFVFEVPLP